jgi:ketosteroid isomerase-like protein
MNAVRTVTTTSACATLLSASLFLGGCGGGAGPNSHAADEKALRDLVDRTVAAAGQRDVATYGKYYAPKWTSALPGQPIAEVASPLKMQFPTGYAIRMVTVKTEISDGGDLGYALGTYEQTAPDKAGVLTHTVGKWMSVFKKQPDGSWGAVADTFNVDPSP